MKIAQTVTINMLGMTFAIDYYPINQNADLDSTHLLKLKRWHDIQLQESRKSPILYRE